MTRSSRPPATRASAVALLGQHPRRARLELFAHGSLRQAPERNVLAARADRLGQRAEIVGDQHHHRVRWRLLEVLEQRVGGVLVHRVGVVEQVDAALRLERAHVQVVTERADVVDPDLVAERLEQVDVRMRVAKDALGLADQLRRRRRARPGACRRRAGRGRGTRARGPRPARRAAGASPRPAQERSRSCPWTVLAISSGAAWRRSGGSAREQFGELAVGRSHAARKSLSSCSIRSRWRRSAPRATRRSTSSRNVRSGSRPRVAWRLSSSTRSTPSPRAIPWYASDESM